MKISDPNRPTWINGTPMYLDRHGNAVSPLPRITIEVKPSSLAVSIMGKVGWNEFTEFFAKQKVTPQNLPELLADWEFDPEGAMEEWFGYKVPDNHSAKHRTNGFGSEKLLQESRAKPGELSLDDLLGA